MQTLNVPGNNKQELFSGGYPVYLDDKTGKVTSVMLTFNYDPALLNVNGASSNSALPGSSFTLNTALSTPGHAVLQYTDSGPTSMLLTGGPMPAPVSAPALGFIMATVPNSSAAVPIYKAKDLLTLTPISINGGTIPTVGASAVHLVAFAAAADGNGLSATTKKARARPAASNSASL